MKLVEVDRGVVFSIWAVDLAEGTAPADCPALAFLEELRKSAKRQHDSLIGVIELHMDHGQIMNERKSRDLGDGILEFKEPRGARLLYFYLPGWRTVLGCGFRKGEKVAPHKARALAMKEALESMP